MKLTLRQYWKLSYGFYRRCFPAEIGARPAFSAVNLAAKQGETWDRACLVFVALLKTNGAVEQWPENAPKTVKSVEWAYPTSTNAKHFGFHDQGCWTVETGECNQPLKAIAGYTDRAEAIRHAETLPFNWSTAFLYCHPEFKQAV